MKKIIISSLVITIITISIAFFLIYQFNTEKIINLIEKKYEIKIELLSKNKWSFYPTITYSNSKINISDKEKKLIVKNANVVINRSYWPLSSILINLSSPNASYSGVEMRNTILKAKFINRIFNIESFTGNIIEGDLHIEGNIDLDNERPFYLKGKFNNISLNTILKQSQIANWQRVNIAISSPNFSISGKAKENSNWINSLKGTIPIKGSMYFTATDEERFGAALLSILAEKIPNLNSISKSLDFLISTYANIPSSINGLLKINNGSILSDEILIINKKGKSSLNGSYSFVENTMNGNVNFFEEDKVFITATLQGEIDNPQILIDGKIFSDHNEQPMQDLKHILQEGINSFIEKLLSVND